MPLTEQESTALSDKRSSLPIEGVLDTLKQILVGAPLADVLASVTRLIETQSQGLLCSIYLLDADGVHLRYAAAPSLPTSYRDATDGLKIGPNVGSCGTAAYLRQPVYVADIQSDPKWTRFGNFATSAGLRAAWSSPIISHDGDVLGTFGMYYRDVRQPGPQDIELIENASRLAGIAIERDRSQTALTLAFDKLKKSEAELRQIVDAIPQAITVLDPEGKALYVNQWVLDFNGFTLADVVSPDYRLKAFHPDDVARLEEERRVALSKGLPFENEQRAFRKDGQYRWFLNRYNPLLDANGRILRWYATGTDIDDRKQAELRISNENLALREELDRSSMHEEIVGSSESLRNVLIQVRKVAPTESTVLILGETGTGKELIAGAIHKSSKRSTRAFIRVNCAAIPPSLIASELFGHEKGAFTGATQRRLGRFESADGGTIFLDEVGELPPDTQVALLRVLQERELERVGSSKPISIDVRVLAATNRDLEAAVAAGTFRQDLFYRLNVFPIYVPSLRERRDDIPLLVAYLVERYAQRTGKRISHINKKTLDHFQTYDWPGNVRELQNVIERAVILSDGPTFEVDETWLRRKSPQSPAVEPHSGRAPSENQQEPAERERKAIEAALTETRGRVSGPKGAAAKLGIPHQTLESKIARLGIDKHRFKS